MEKLGEAITGYAKPKRKDCKLKVTLSTEIRPRKTELCLIGPVNMNMMILRLEIPGNEPKITLKYFRQRSQIFVTKFRFYQTGVNVPKINN